MRNFFLNAASPAATEPAQPNTSWRWLLLVCALLAVPASAAPFKGEAVERERILPPADSMLVIGLENTASAGAPDPCASAGTQAALGQCSYEGFLKATAAMSAQLRQVEAGLKPGQRTTWRRVQKAWLTYRTQACHFESSQLANASERATAQWTCAARMTRERSAELSRLTACGDGDVACPIPIRPGGKMSRIFSRRR